MKLILATRNVSKAREMLEILQRLLSERWQILNLTHFPPYDEPEESEDTYEGNALIKARAAAKVTGNLCIADDAGLEIDALGGAPGVHSKRFGGDALSFPQKIDRVLTLLEGVPTEHRSARFRCVVALADCSGFEQSFEATCEGVIASEPRGNGGFGYDPIFFYPPAGKTFAEMTPDEKHAVSHRGKVLRLAAEALAARR